LYLEPEKAQLLDELSAQTRIPKAVLLREAVEVHKDDLSRQIEAL
jgi:predicted DNA-binding protein